MTDPAAHQGCFITFEGIEGCGKSTQLKLLAARLEQAGARLLVTVEPGGPPIGRQIRQILLDPANHALSPTAELLLYFAARAQNVDECILPALREGRIVLCDRFTDSTLAYQGYGRGLGEQVVLALDAIACRGLKPQLTILLTIEPELGLQRARRRNEQREADNLHPDTRMDEQTLEFYRRAAAGYRTLALREPDRFRVIDGAGSIEEVAARVWEAVQPAVRAFLR